MVDVTARFEAFFQCSRIPVDSSPSLLSEAWELFLQLDAVASSANVCRTQEQIEALELRAQLPVEQAAVGILFDKLRQRLSDLQTHDMEKLKRELAMEKYFQPARAVVRIRQVPQDAYFPNLAAQPTSSPDLEGEAAMLLATYQTDADQIVSVRRQLQETGALLSLLSAKAVEQEEMVGVTLERANDSIAYVESAEEHLKKAIRHNSSYRFYVVTWFLLLSLAIFVMDMVM